LVTHARLSIFTNKINVLELIEGYGIRHFRDYLRKISLIFNIFDYQNEIFFIVKNIKEKCTKFMIFVKKNALIL